LVEVSRTEGDRTTTSMKWHDAEDLQAHQIDDRHEEGLRLLRLD
jgi:hypothetical protein